MTQHDYNIANQTMPSARTDLNNALLSVVSNNSGSSAPSTTFAYMLWADTTTGLLKIRNAANSAWIIVGDLATDGLNFKTHTANPNGSKAGDFIGQMAYDTTNNRQYVCTTAGASGAAVWTPILLAGVRAVTGTSDTILTTDRAKLVTFSNASAIAVTLPQSTSSATGFPAGWFIDVQNLGAGTVTITPTTSTIDGAASITLSTNQGCRIFADGTNYLTQRGASAGSGLTYLGTSGAISTGTSVVSFTTASWFSSYRHLMFKHYSCQPVNDGVNYTVVGSTDGGSSYLASTNYEYINNGRNTADASKTASAAGTANIILNTSDAIGNSTQEHLTGEVHLFNANGADWKTLQWITSHRTGGTVTNHQSGTGTIKTTSAINALRFLFAAGNYNQGRIDVYGVA